MHNYVYMPKAGGVAQSPGRQMGFGIFADNLKYMSLSQLEVMYPKAMVGYCTSKCFRTILM